MKTITTRKTDTGTVYDYRCARPAGCGADGEPFVSAGWPGRAGAEERAADHEAEHDEVGQQPAADTATDPKG